MPNRLLQQSNINPPILSRDSILARSSRDCVRRRALRVTVEKHGQTRAVPQPRLSHRQYHVTYYVPHTTSRAGYGRPVRLPGLKLPHDRYTRPTHTRLHAPHTLTPRHPGDTTRESRDLARRPISRTFRALHVKTQISATKLRIIHVTSFVPEDPPRPVARGPF